MDKIKKQIECYVPITSCTLRCHYCYITHQRLFDNKLPELTHSPEFIREHLTQKRLGGPCSINMCGGGETLLMPIILQYARALAEEGHYVSIVTNATVSKRFDELLEFPKEVTSHIFFKFSYHYMELKKRGLLDKFFENIQKARRAGCSFTLEITPSDELIPYIDELKELAIEKVGAIPHCTIARDERDPQKLPILTNMSDEEYVKTWSTFDSELFRFKKSIFNVPQKDFCYAGKWSFFFDLLSGDARPCYNSHIHKNLYEDESPIDFPPVGCSCSEYHCYNGHAFLTWGLVPSLKTPTYAEMRNRICEDGSEWLQPELKAFFSSKLKESNREYMPIEKYCINWYIRHKSKIDRFCGKIRGIKSRFFGNRI